MGHAITPPLSNIARLGLTLFLTAHRRPPSPNARLSSLKVKPALLYKAGATLLLPSQGITPRPTEGKHVCYAGWSFSPLAQDISSQRARRGAEARSHLRKRVLERSIMRA